MSMECPVQSDQIQSRPIPISKPQHQTKTPINHFPTQKTTLNSSTETEGDKVSWLVNLLRIPMAAALHLYNAPISHLNSSFHGPKLNFNETRRRYLHPTILSHRRNHTNSLRPLLSSSPTRPARYAVLGAGFAGLSVAWHLLELSPKGSSVCVDVIDEVGIGGGASGSSGGLLHPYSPKARVLWRGGECWKECMKLLDIAERTQIANSVSDDGQIVWRRGILRPAMTRKNTEILKQNSQNCLQSCSIEVLDSDSVHNIIPGLSMPFNCALRIPSAVNIHPKRYLQALFLACQNLATGEGKEINLLKKSFNCLRELADEYDSVIICLGAKVDMLPELSGKLPLRTCRGVIAHLHLPTNSNEGREFKPDTPSILSEAWLAIRGPRDVLIGSTWEWNSRNYSSKVLDKESSTALENVLLPKASAVYPAITKWEFVRASAGLRAMPPLTANGSLPLLGSVDDALGDGGGCRYWVVAGLGSRGLLYHGLVGKLMAQAVVSSDEGVIPSELVSWKKDGNVCFSKHITTV